MVVVTSGFAVAVACVVLILGFLNICNKENSDWAATFFNLSRWFLTYHLNYYLTDVLKV